MLLHCMLLSQFHPRSITTMSYKNNKSTSQGKAKMAKKRERGAASKHKLNSEIRRKPTVEEVLGREDNISPGLRRMIELSMGALTSKKFKERREETKRLARIEHNACMKRIHEFRAEIASCQARAVCTLTCPHFQSIEAATAKVAGGISA